MTAEGEETKLWRRYRIGEEEKSRRLHNVILVFIHHQFTSQRTDTRCVYVGKARGRRREREKD
jgi:hypothetical protein